MPAPGPLIFISYRGGDAEWAPDYIHAALAAEFGEESLFKAGNNLRAGDEYPPILEQSAASCPVMLVCIGPRWLGAQNPDGTRRLDDPHDWVRREIELALKNDRHLVPLLTGNPGDTNIPSPQDLPESIAPLAFRQAFRLERGGRLRITVPDLVARLTDLVPSLVSRTNSAAGGGISARMQIGSLRGGKATAVRGPESVAHQIDAEMTIEEIDEAGDAVVVDLLSRSPAQGSDAR